MTCITPAYENTQSTSLVNVWCGRVLNVCDTDTPPPNPYLLKLITIHPNNRALHAYRFIYGTAKKKRPGYLVGNLVATNWPIEKALHAIGYNQIPTK